MREKCFFSYVTVKTHFNHQRSKYPVANPKATVEKSVIALQKLVLLPVRMTVLSINCYLL